MILQRNKIIRIEPKIPVPDFTASIASVPEPILTATVPNAIAKIVPSEAPK